MTRAQSTIARDALSLPVIAYRGLWDKCAAPLSNDAVRRSYLRGVPSLVRCADAKDVSNALEIAMDRAVNRRRRPVYLVVDALRDFAISHLPPDASAIFAIDHNKRSDRSRPIYQWRVDAWSASGVYVPLAASRQGISADDLCLGRKQNPVVIFESTNVVDDVRLSPLPDGVNDDAIYAAVRARTGATADVFRVSDLVELDWLHQRIREAA